MQPQTPIIALDHVDRGSAVESAGQADPDRSAEVHQVEGTLTLMSGETVQVRAIHPEDTKRLQAFHAHLSVDSIVFRFFHYLPALPLADAERFTHVDYRDRMALAAVTPLSPRAASGTLSASDEDDKDDDDEAILGVVRYERIGPETAEVAFVVADQWQGRGIATALLHRLAAYARTYGISQFLAITMASNNRMLAVLRHAGYPLTVGIQDGEAEVTLDISRHVAGEPGLVAVASESHIVGSTSPGH